MSILATLDEAVDRVAETFHRTAMPVIEDAATRLDRVLDGSGARFAKGVRSRALALDDRYQRFMIRRVDPLFGQTRRSQLDEMGGLEISDQEVTLNRRIAFSALALITLLLGRTFFPPSLILLVPASFALVLPVFASAYRSLKSQRRVTYHLVSCVNMVGIWLCGFYTPAIAATMFYYAGEKLLMATEDRSQKGIIAVFSKQPRTVWLLQDGREEERPFGEILPGDVIVVRAGEFMPVDGTVVDGMASIDQQMLTGEAQPVEKAPDDTVYASTVVLGGKVQVRVEKAGNETVAAKIGEILNRTASYQLALQSKGTKIAHASALPTLLVGGLALATLGAESGIAVLNSSFGVNLRLSAPVTMLNLLNIASSNAILFKDGRSLELLSDVDTVLFDKTGTLTLSQPNVAAIHCTDQYDEDRLLTFAAAAEHRQTHPIALAVLAEAQARGLVLPDVEHARYDVGYGIKVELLQQVIQVGSERFMRLSGIDVPNDMIERWKAGHERGHSLILVAVDGLLAGAIELQPTIRPEADAVIQALRKRGLEVVIISGDHEEPTRRLAHSLGVDRYFADVLPEGKADYVKQLQAEGRAVCFVGDGINDSIALKKANVSVSLRGATTVATDAAQVVLMQESLRQLPYLFGLADEMENSMKACYAAGMIPGAMNVAGVFLLGTGFYPAIALNMASIAVSLGIAMYPMYKHKKELAHIAMPAGRAVPALKSPADAPLLLPSASLA